MRPQDRVKAHLEALLGPVAQTTTARATENAQAAVCSIATFEDQPVEGAFTLVTLGLSDTPLHGPEGEVVRQELLLCAWKEDRDDRLYSLLFSAAQAFHDDGETANPGAVLELDGPLSDRGDITQVFLYPPTYHPENLETVPAATGADGEEIEILWLIPITGDEVKRIGDKGLEAFEDYLAATDPDLLDLGRG